MSAKKKFALMHIEAMASGKSEVIIFGYRITLEYREREIEVNIYGNTQIRSEVAGLAELYLLFKAPVIRTVSPARITLVSKRADVFHII